MKRRRQRGNTLVAGLAGVALVVVVSLALNLLAFRSQGLADEQQPILPTLPVTATPTVPALPAAAPDSAGGTLAAPTFTSPDSLAAWEFVDVGVPAAMANEAGSVWTVRDGALLQNRTRAAGNPNFFDTMAFTGDENWSDYVVSASFYDEGNSNAGVIARRQGDSFYRFRLLAEPASDTPKLVLEKVVNGEVTVLASQEGSGYDYRVWNTIALSVSGTTLQATFNGTVVLEAEDATLSSGQAGLFTTARGGIRFGDVRVSRGNS